MDTATAWLSVGHEAPTESIRLFCLPYAGGDAWIFRNWQNLIRKGILVCPLHLPGRGKRIREPAFNRVYEFVRAITASLSGYFSSPFAIFGHSLGSVLAYEIVRHLAAAGGPQPVHLFLSGQPVPTQGKQSTLPPTYLLPDEAFLTELENRYGAAPHNIRENEELMKLILPALRADMELYETYVYKDAPPLSCPLAVFAGDDDGVILGKLKAWRHKTSGAFKLKTFPGGHFYLHEQENDLVHAIGTLLGGDRSNS